MRIPFISATFVAAGLTLPAFVQAQQLRPENDRRLQRVEQILGVQAQGQELKSA